MKIIDVKHTSETDVVTAAVEILQQGGLVVFPTETTYGAGVDATNPQAVEKLLAYKSRREGKPLSIAVTSMEMATKYVDINDSAVKIYKRFLPGPVTVVSQGKGVVAPGVESEFATLGVRIPDYPLILKIVETLGSPITATSANASGEKRPYALQDIFDNISDKQKELIDLVLDAGTLPPNPPSTVIDTTLSTPITVRTGALEVAQQKDLTELISHSETETKAIAGKLLLQHWNQIKERGLVIGLDGPLGAGKTIFTKGVAEFLQIEDVITSPTYTYVEEYGWERHKVQGKLFHYDVWKVDQDALLERLEFHQQLLPQNVLIVEWWQNIANFPKVKEAVSSKNSPLFIHVSIDDQESNRKIAIEVPQS